ncbi:MAG: DinB family protein [Janthinobacterium lividum]
MLPKKTFEYLLIDLEASPKTLALMLASMSDPADYDKRPDPDRFTLREMVAHLADWDDVFLGRLIQTRDEEMPILQGLDEGQIALANNYAAADPKECLARYEANRRRLVSVLRGLTPEQWERVGNHTELGPITMATQAVLVGAHDGYHRCQTLDWLAVGPAAKG